MEEILIQDINTLKTKENTSVLLIWSEGCSVCTEVKPLFKNMSKKFDNMNFLTLQLNSDLVYDFYSKFVEAEDVKQLSLDSDGDPILDANGQPISSYVRDDEGNILRKAPLSVPRYFVFNKESITDTSEWGFLGKVDGHNDELLDHILTTLDKGSIE